MDKEKNSIERQKYQMIKTGFDVIAKWLEKIANKKEVDVRKVEIQGASLVTIKGDKGDDGHTPTDTELLAIIKPLIPVLRQPEDGHTPTEEELLSLIKPLIPIVKDGETPSDEKLLSLIKPLIPEPVDEQKIVEEVKKLSIKELKKLIPENDTPEEIIKKLLSIKKAWLPAEAITGDLVQHITRVVKQFGGSSGGISESRVIEIIKQQDITLDDKVKYDVNDPTAGYLSDKIVAGTGITLSEGTGANENKLVITNDAPASEETDPLSIHKGNIFLYKKDGEVLTYKTAVDSDIERGLSLIEALSDSVSGDSVVVGTGTYQVTSSYFEVPDGVSLGGIDRDNSILYKSVSHSPQLPTVIVGDGVSISDLTIKGSGLYNDAVLGATKTVLCRITNCLLDSNTDCINDGNRGTWIIKNSEFKQKYDSLNGAYATFYVYNSTFNNVGYQQDNLTRCVCAGEGCVINLYNCKLKASFANGTVATIATADAGIVNAYQCLIEAEGDANDIYGIQCIRAEDGEVNLFDCILKSSGPSAVDITVISSTVKVTRGSGSATNGYYTGSGFNYYGVELDPVWNSEKVSYALKTDYLALNQTTPQTTIGRFTFPDLTVGTNTIHTINDKVLIGSVTDVAGKLQVTSGDNILRFMDGGAGLTPTLSLGTKDGKSAGLIAGTAGTAFIFDRTGSFAINKDDKTKIDNGTSVGGDQVLSILADGSTMFYNAVVSNQMTLGSRTGIGFGLDSDSGYGLYIGKSASTGNSWLQAGRIDSATAYNLSLQASGGNVGIGTTAPGSKLTVDGHVGTLGTIPTLSSAGTGASITTGSTDTAGEITEGTLATGAVITFANAYTNVPFAVVTSQSGLLFSYTVSTSSITITNIEALSSTKLNYQVVARE